MPLLSGFAVNQSTIITPLATSGSVTLIPAGQPFVLREVLLNIVYLQGALITDFTVSIHSTETGEILNYTFNGEPPLSYNGVPVVDPINISNIVNSTGLILTFSNVNSPNVYGTITTRFDLPTNY